LTKSLAAGSRDYYRRAIVDFAKAKQQEVRAHLLKALDRSRPNPTPEALLIRSLQQSGLTPSREQLQQELGYLQAKGLLNHHEALWWLLPLGTDILEHSVPAPAGIPQPNGWGPNELLHRKEVRSRILTALYYARPHGIPSSILWRALDDSDLPVTQVELVRETHYLSGKELVDLSGDLNRDWHAKLNAEGIDLMEYATEPPPGIERIEKYWEG
jgi:hypothetical protein